VWRNSKIWLNGQPVRERMGYGAGYTSFSVRLDNVTSLRYGGRGARTHLLCDVFMLKTRVLYYTKTGSGQT
jgi:hypothetical protein